MIHGFVEELVVNDDPEYQWIDKIRTPRASNEARQVVFLKLSAQVMPIVYFDLSRTKRCFNRPFSGSTENRIEGNRFGRKCCDRIRTMFRFGR